MSKTTTGHQRVYVTTDGVAVLWLTPDKPENISVGRQRIADHLESRGFEVTVRGTSRRTVLRSLRERYQYDVVLGTTRAGAISGVLLKLVGTPLVVDHVDPIQQFAGNNPRWLTLIVRLLENLSFLTANHVLYVYDEERPRIERYASAYSKTNLGVEFDRFADPEHDAVTSARNRLESLDLQEQIAIYVGGLEPIYHIEELLAAIDRLPDWSLVVVGDGSLRDIVSTAAAERPDVNYIGTVPHETVPGYLRAADVGISLVDDPYTLKVLEYGAAGLPVVQAAGQAEARFGDQVEYCEPDPVAVANAIERAADRTSAPRELASNFDWSVVADHYEKIIESTV